MSYLHIILTGNTVEVLIKRTKNFLSLQASTGKKNPANMDLEGLEGVFTVK